MDENKTSTSTKNTAPLSGRELMTAVRDILVNNPERHNQEVWVSNIFDVDTAETLVDKARPFARLPVPDEPVNADEPVCGTTGCVAGWAVILGAPAGTAIDNSSVYLPYPYTGAYSTGIPGYAADLLGLSLLESGWLFSMDRDREELIAALGAKLADQDANILPDVDEEDWEDEEDEEDR